jgi:hypothetical protein
MALFDCFDEFYEAISCDDDHTGGCRWKRVKGNFWRLSARKRSLVSNFLENEDGDDGDDGVLDESLEQDEDEKVRRGTNSGRDGGFYIGAKCELIHDVCIVDNLCA